MPKRMISATVDLDILTKFDELGLNRSSFIEDAMSDEIEGVRKKRVVHSSHFLCALCNQDFVEREVVKFKNCYVCKSCYRSSSLSQIRNLCSGKSDFSPDEVHSQTAEPET